MKHKQKAMIVCGVLAFNLALYNAFYGDLRVGIYWTAVTVYWVLNCAGR